ncbi:integrase catalytic region [Caballeronia terrestris]|uniref:Integrase catalytic region n=2 Tax=Caballeronia terrestris TaxID=1226301 RepID=A0A158K978_9BURK|nr:integrase catalytic region [Caballeronia terrestris]
MPNWAAVNRDLGRKGVTLDLLWNEYKAQEPEGYGYSWFCKHYERWAAALPVTLRQTHTPGEKLFNARRNYSKCMISRKISRWQPVL